MLAFKFFTIFHSAFMSFFLFIDFFSRYFHRNEYFIAQNNTVPQSAINPTIQFVLFENSGKRTKLIFSLRFEIVFWVKAKCVFFSWNFVCVSSEKRASKLRRTLQLAINGRKVNLICVLHVLKSQATWNWILVNFLTRGKFKIFYTFAHWFRSSWWISMT